MYQARNICLQWRVAFIQSISDFQCFLPNLLQHTIQPFSAQADLPFPSRPLCLALLFLSVCYLEGSVRLKKAVTQTGRDTKKGSLSLTPGRLCRPVWNRRVSIYEGQGTKSLNRGYKTLLFRKTIYTIYSPRP